MPDLKEIFRLSKNKLTPAELNFYICFASYADFATGFTFVRLNTVAHTLGIFPQNASRIYKKLKSEGWIEKVKGGFICKIGFKKSNHLDYSSATKTNHSDYKINRNDYFEKCKTNQGNYVGEKENNPGDYRGNQDDYSSLKGDYHSINQNKTEQLSVAAPEATRISKDFKLTPDMRDWAEKNLPELTPEIESATELWKDYYLALPGPKALSNDWEASWRRGMNQHIKHKHEKGVKQNGNNNRVGSNPGNQANEQQPGSDGKPEREIVDWHRKFRANPTIVK